MDGLYLWKLAFMDTKVVKFKNNFLFICRWKKMPPISLREFELVIKMQVKTGWFPRPPTRYFVQCLAVYPYWAQLPSTKWQWLKSNEGWPLLNASMLHSLVEFSAGKKASSTVQSAALSTRKYWICLKELFYDPPPQNSKPLIEQQLAPLTKKSRKTFYGGPRIRDKERGFRKPDFFNRQLPRIKVGFSSLSPF